MIRSGVLLILFFFTICACTQNKKVSFTVTAEKPYCGGARPTPEMVKASQTPVPFSNRRMILVKSDGKIDSVRTDSAGMLNLTLREGTYHLFESWRYYKTLPAKSDLSGFDKVCLESEWKQPNKVILVTRSGFSVKDSSAVVLYCPWRLPCISDLGNNPVPD